MIPFQQLQSRKGEPIPFLRWVKPEELGGLSKICYYPTFVQLVTTLYSLSKAYGLHVKEPTAEDFLAASMEVGNATCSPPSLFLKSSDPNQILCFNWATWMERSDFII